jgi:hypothetical protein
MKLHYSKLQTFKPFMVTAILLLVAPMVMAGPYIPSAGSILQQIKPSMPVVPSSSETGLVIDTGEAGTSNQRKQPCNSVVGGATKSDKTQPNSNAEPTDKPNSKDENLAPCR